MTGSRSTALGAGALAKTGAGAGVSVGARVGAEGEGLRARLVRADATAASEAVLAEPVFARRELVPGSGSGSKSRTSSLPLSV